MLYSQTPSVRIIPDPICSETLMIPDPVIAHPLLNKLNVLFPVITVLDCLHCSSDADGKSITSSQCYFNISIINNILNDLFLNSFHFHFSLGFSNYVLYDLFQLAAKAQLKQIYNIYILLQVYFNYQKQVNNNNTASFATKFTSIV